MFRFTIRDVLWLTVVVALGVGWGIDQSQPRILHIEPHFLARGCNPGDTFTVKVWPDEYWEMAKDK
jgi:hypothetical protein